jgi:hypothetical protein
VLALWHASREHQPVLFQHRYLAMPAVLAGTRFRAYHGGRCLRGGEIDPMVSAADRAQGSLEDLEQVIEQAFAEARPRELKKSSAP